MGVHRPRGNTQRFGHLLGGLSLHTPPEENLTPLTRYGFRVSVTNPDGIAGAWSQVVYILVD